MSPRFLVVAFFLACAVTSALVWSWREAPRSPQQPGSVSAHSRTVGTLGDVQNLERPRSISIESERESGGLNVGGELRIYSNTLSELRMKWSSGDLTVIEADGRVRWSARLSEGEHRLENAWLGGSEALILRPVTVSRENPEAEIVILGAGEVVLDLVDANTGMPVEEARIEVVETPSAAGVPTSSRIERTRGGTAAPVVQVGGQSIHDLDPESIAYIGRPIRLPQANRGSSIRIESAGYRIRIVRPLPHGGYQRVEMEPLKSVLLLFSNSPSPAARYDVIVRSSNTEVARRYPVISESAELEFECAMQSEDLLVEISAVPTLGIAPVSQAIQVRLQPKGRTVVNVDLSRESMSTASCQLALTVSTSASTQGMSRWTVRLSPMDESGKPLLMGEFPRSSLSKWECLSPEREYFMEFDNLWPGRYELVIDPIGFVQALDLGVADSHAIRVDVPAVTDLWVWPVDSSGEAIDDGLELGILAWRPVTKVERKGDDSHALDGGGDAEFILALERGVLQFASGTKDGAWLIRAPSGQEIEIEFVGPAALGAVPLTADLVPGAMEVSLEFSNL
jgi:hypothetical protein